MTNWEWICSNKENLISICMEDVNVNMLLDKANDWLCLEKCPHRIGGKCMGHECMDKHSDEEIFRMWLDEEYKEK